MSKLFYNQMHLCSRRARLNEMKRRNPCVPHGTSQAKPETLNLEPYLKLCEKEYFPEKTWTVPEMMYLAQFGNISADFNAKVLSVCKLGPVATRMHTFCSPAALV